MSLNAKRSELTEEDRAFLSRMPEEMGEDVDIDRLYDEMSLEELEALDMFDRSPCAVEQLRSVPEAATSAPQSSQMTLKQAFQILLNAEEGKFEADFPMRQSASPINPRTTCFYVDPYNTTKKRKKVSHDADALPSISVKYQSFYNSEVYWSPNHSFLTGICARGMSKRRRKQKDVETAVHGFNGRWFTLLRRTAKERDSDTSKNIRAYVVPSYSLVQFWKSVEEMNLNLRVASSEERSVETESLSSDQISTTSSSFYTKPAQTVKGNMHVVGDLMVQGDLTMRNLHVKGDLLVEGSISGQLVTPPGAADYAEWFMFLDPKEKIQTGMVVQLRSPEQKITLNTSGEGPLLVVSTTPSVAAGVPPGNRASQGALCAFIGQVPVRVKGKISCGDFIFPSGDNDGYGVSGSFIKHRDRDPLGTAMVASDEEEARVLAFVRWQHNLKWKILNESLKDLRNAITAMWMWTIVCVTFEHVVLGSFLYFHPSYRVDRVFYVLGTFADIFCFSHFPDYPE